MPESNPVYRSKYLLLVIICILFTQCAKKEPLSPADSFKAKGYTQEEIMMFCDLCFSPTEDVLKKWETNIKVEVKNLDEVTDRDIADVDSCIAILAPLVYPLKMERVESDGNLWVYVNTELYYPAETGLGIALNRTPRHIKEIKRMDIYKIRSVPQRYLLHEFSHALGLWHPQRRYDFFINMLGYGSPVYELTWEEFEYLSENKFPISEQEKKVIQMLYSSDFKSGYTRSRFLDEMGIRNEWEQEFKE